MPGRQVRSIDIDRRGQASMSRSGLASTGRIRSGNDSPMLGKRSTRCRPKAECRASVAVPDRENGRKKEFQAPAKASIIRTRWSWPANSGTPEKILETCREMVTFDGIYP